jgi:hypothetical protein
VKQSWWAWTRTSPRIAFAATALLLAMLWIGYRQEPVPQLPFTPEQADAAMMQDISVLEDHDALSNFEPLKELPAPVDPSTDTDSDNQM